jgi:hypothetical protein
VIITKLRDNIYCLDMNRNTTATAMTAAITGKRLHRSGMKGQGILEFGKEKFRKIADMVIGMEMDGGLGFCEACILGKHHRDSFLKQNESNEREALELVFGTSGVNSSFLGGLLIFSCILGVPVSLPVVYVGWSETSRDPPTWIHSYKTPNYTRNTHQRSFGTRCCLLPL